MSFKSTLHFEHGPLFQNRLPVPNLMARGARQTRLEVPPSLHHSNLNRAAVIAKAIKESVKKDSADVKDTLGRQKYNQGEVSRAMVGQVKLRNWTGFWAGDVVCLSEPTDCLNGWRPVLETTNRNNHGWGTKDIWGGPKSWGSKKKGCKVWNLCDFYGFCFLPLGDQNWFLGPGGLLPFTLFPLFLAVLVSHIQFYHFFKTCHSVSQCFTSIIPISVVYLWLGTTITSGMIISLAILFH